jgi:sulfate ABC transporter ATP-binding protein
MPAEREPPNEAQHDPKKVLEMTSDKPAPTAERANAITVTGANKRYGDFVALDDIDFVVPEGSLTALLGPSGSGKSTLLRAIAGLDQPDTGTITIQGKDVTNVPPQRRGIGFVFQHYAAFKHLTVRDNVGFGLKIRKRPKAEIKDKVDNLLEVVGLAGFHTRYPNQLSGGQRQRMALARALAVDPQVLLLDEPFGALDAKVREDLRVWLRKLHDEVHVTTVLVTHDQAEALSLGQQVAVLWNGKLVQNASAEEIYRRPATRELASFVGDAVLLRGIADGNFASCALGRLPLSSPVATGPVDVMIRPEQIRLAAETSPASREAIVIDVGFNGRDALVTLRLKHAEECTVVACVPGFRAPRIDEQVHLSVKGDAVAYRLSRDS